MKTSIHKVAIVSCLLISCLTTGRISNINLAHEYSSLHEPFAIESELVHENDSSLVFLKIIKTPGKQVNNKEILSKSLSDSLKNQLVLRIRIMPSYESRKNLFTDTLLYEEDKLENGSTKDKDGKSVFFLNFKIPRFKNQNSLLGINVTEIKYPSDTSCKTVHFSKNISQIIVHTKMIHLPVQEEKHNSVQYFIFRNPENKEPFFRNYLHVNEPFIIDFPSRKNRALPLNVHCFDVEFIPAPPPMASIQKENEEKIKNNPGDPQSLQSKEMIRLSTNKIERFHTDGLYLIILKDSVTLEEYKTSVVVVNTSYPKIEETAQMVPPLIYLCSKDEYATIKDSQDQKKVIDDFWLKIARDKNHARNMIREFYSRVEYANSLFTSHKEGWKTDRGMIFIIFGEPQSVYRTGTSEVWEYYFQMDFQTIAFKFLKRDNIFSLNHYEMLRTPGYTEIWYSAVEQWRSGVLKAKE